MPLSTRMLSSAVLALALSIAPSYAQEPPASAEARLQQSRDLVAQAEAARNARDNARAIGLYERALSAREAVLGPNDPTLVPILEALAALHREAKNAAAALAYQKRSAAIERGSAEAATAPRTRSTRAVSPLEGGGGAHGQAEARQAQERARTEQERALAAQARAAELERAREQQSRLEQLKAAEQQQRTQGTQRSMGVAPPQAGPYEPMSARPEAHSSAPGRPQVELPNFPWPPATPSTQSTLANSLFQAPGARPTSLAYVGDRLVKALEQARYFEYSYYRVPSGFALVARLERIGVDGTPMPEEFRFLAPGSAEPFSLGVYVRQLFFAPAGFYRQIVFAVTDQPFTASGEKLDTRAAQRLLSGGANRLSNDYESAPFTARHAVTALVYEFRKGTKEGDVSTLTPGRLGARTHLERAGLFSTLAPSK